MRRTALLLCAGLAAVWIGASGAARGEEGAAGDPPAAAEPPPEGAPHEPGRRPAVGEKPGLTWYAQALAQGPGGLNVTQFWSKGPYLRAETVVAGHKIVTIVRDEWYYAYDATRADGIRVRRSPEARAQDAPYRRPFGNEAVKLIREGAEKVGEEDFHGREAEIYRLTDRRAKRTVWAMKDALNITLRVEMYNRATASMQSTDYTDWLTGLTLPDRYFKPDPVVRIVSYELEQYSSELARLGSVGPVPILYYDLLRGY